MVTVFYISGCVVLFRGIYMSHENFLGRFLSLVAFFVLSIVLLILFPNYVRLIMG